MTARARRALVTGAGGFIGRHLVRELERHGTRVTGLVRRGRVGGPHVAMGDAPWEPRRLAGIIEDTQPDTVFHLAGGAVGTVAQLDAMNVGLARSVMEALGSTRAKPLLVCCGSAAEYGSGVTDGVATLAEAAAKQEDLGAAVAQAQSRMAEAEVVRAKVVQAHTSQVTLDLEAAAREVGDLRRAVAAMRAVVAVLGEGQDAPPGATSRPPELHIVRRGPGGTFLVPASDTTPLMPGDVLQIGPIAGPARPDAADPHF